MDRDEIRKRTAVVVRRNNQYLAGADWTGQLQWTQYIYDAFRTRDMERALRLAIYSGGVSGVV